jgi:hypothetical protein
MSEATGNRRTSMRATGKPFNIDKISMIGTFA